LIPVRLSTFNWSAAATQSNDEFLFILRGGRIARLYAEYFDKLWTNGRTLGNDFVGEDLPPGSIVINEIMWFGLHTDDPEGTDEFIELRNTTDQTVDLSMWQIVNDNDFVVGLPPGSVVGPNDTFLILDHTMEPYEDGMPQDEYAGYLAGDLVVNPYNDNRQSRLYIKDGALKLALQDPAAWVVSRCSRGCGTPETRLPPCLRAASLGTLGRNAGGHLRRRRCGPSLAPCPTMPDRPIEGEWTEREAVTGGVRSRDRRSGVHRPDRLRA